MLDLTPNPAHVDPTRERTPETGLPEFEGRTAALSETAASNRVGDRSVGVSDRGRRWRSFGRFFLQLSTLVGIFIRLRRGDVGIGLSFPALSISSLPPSLLLQAVFVSGVAKVLIVDRHHFLLGDGCLLYTSDAADE